MNVSAGMQIEQESFRIIRSEMKPNDFSEEELAVVMRVIHTTGDFEYAENIRFSAGAIQFGLQALRAHRPVITDVEMVKAGINRAYAGEVHCWMHDAETVDFAKQNELTRATAAFRLHQATLSGAIIAIGNAPTALLEVLRMAHKDGIHPALVVGVPVGFVSAVESKDLLNQSDLPFITALGRKGGSPIAASILNALMRLV